jgi:hypothetical protein
MCTTAVSLSRKPQDTSGLVIEGVAVRDCEKSGVVMTWVCVRIGAAAQVIDQPREIGWRQERRRQDQIRDVPGD